DRPPRRRRSADRGALRLHPADSGSAGVDLPRDDGGLAAMVDMKPPAELFGTTGCPYTSELREHLVWNRVALTEYDVEGDATARARLFALTGAQTAVPVLVEDGRVTQIGWRGRSCGLTAR